MSGDKEVVIIVSSDDEKEITQPNKGKEITQPNEKKTTFNADIVKIEVSEAAKLFTEIPKTTNVAPPVAPTINRITPVLVDKGADASSTEARKNSQTLTGTGRRSTRFNSEENPLDLGWFNPAKPVSGNAREELDAFGEAMTNLSEKKKKEIEDGINKLSKRKINQTDNHEEEKQESKRSPYFANERSKTDGSVRKEREESENELSDFIDDSSETHTTEEKKEAEEAEEIEETEEKEEKKVSRRGRKPKNAERVIPENIPELGAEDVVSITINNPTELVRFGPFQSNQRHKILYSAGNVFIPIEFLQTKNLFRDTVRSFSRYREIADTITVMGNPVIIPKIYVASCKTSATEDDKFFLVVELGMEPTNDNDDLTEESFGFIPYTSTLTPAQLFTPENNHKKEIYLSMALMTILSIYGRKLSNFYIKNGAIYFLGFYSSNFTNSQQWGEKSEKIYGTKFGPYTDERIMEYEKNEDLFWLRSGIEAARDSINMLGPFLSASFRNKMFFKAELKKYAESAGMSIFGRVNKYNRFATFCDKIYDSQF